MLLVGFIIRSYLDYTFISFWPTLVHGSKIIYAAGFVYFLFAIFLLLVSLLKFVTVQTRF